MKAKYIIDACVAMKDLEGVTYSTPADAWARLIVACMEARCALIAHSGITDIEIAVERDEKAAA